MPAGPVLNIRGTLEMREKMGNIEVGIGIQTANVENAPDATPTVVLARKTTDGVHYGDDYTGVASATKGKQLMRFVWLTANTSGSDLNFARVGGFVDVEFRD